MTTSVKNRIRNVKQRIERRLDGAREDAGRAVLSEGKIRVEMADKTRAISHTGIGLVHQLAQATGLAEAIDRQVHVLMVHRPCRQDGQPRGGHIYTDFRDECEGSKVTIAATSFLRYNHLPIKRYPPSGHTMVWMEEQEIPPVAKAVASDR